MRRPLIVDGAGLLVTFTKVTGRVSRRAVCLHYNLRLSKHGGKTIKMCDNVNQQKTSSSETETKWLVLEMWVNSYILSQFLFQ